MHLRHVIHGARRLTVVSALLAVAFGVTAAAAVAQSAAAPASTGAPVITGQPYVGKILTTTAGTWTNSPTSYTYQWVRCDTAGNNCAQIPSATAKTYTPTSADVNHTLLSWVTATNGTATTGPVNSKPTDVITPALPPTNTTAPSIVGKPLVGETLFADPGKYSGGAVVSFKYQWQRCPLATLTCTDIVGATGQSYKVVTADVDLRLRAQVVATNPFGEAATSSAPTAKVTVPVVTVTTTLTASATSTICCQRIRLSGVITPVKAGETVTILSREADDIASYPEGTATTDAAGAWFVMVTPMIQTAYTAQTSTSTSQPVTTLVHPRVGFGVNGNTFSAKITGRDSFAGSVALFQRQNANGSWTRIGLVVVNHLSVATFKVVLPKGRTYSLRIYLPQAQAGKGYLDGTSHTRRVGGTG